MMKRSANVDYMWRAEYEDGTIFDESEYGTFTKVDPIRVHNLSLIDTDGNVTCKVLIPHGSRAAFFRRVYRRVSIVTGQQFDRGRAYCIGWETDNGGCYWFVFPNGSMLMTTDRYGNGSDV